MHLAIIICTNFSKGETQLKMKLTDTTKNEEIFSIIANLTFTRNHFFNCKLYENIPPTPYFPGSLLLFYNLQQSNLILVVPQDTGNRNFIRVNLVLKYLDELFEEV